jgi:hypothetical protein
MLRMCVYMHSRFVENHPIRILEDGPLISEGVLSHMEDLDAKDDLSYQEYPVMILETSQRVTRNKKIKMCKVQWSHHTDE